MQLGEVTLDRNLEPTEKIKLSDNLKKLGFELIDDKISQTIERIKKSNCGFSALSRCKATGEFIHLFIG
jgi:hypothetical protein